MKLLRRSILALLVVAALALLAFGPKPKDQAPPGRVLVQYWEKWGGREAIQMRQIVDEFNNTIGREKSIYVQYLTQAEIDHKALIATAGGVPPDVAGVWDYNIPAWAAMDALEPLDDYAKAYGITRDYYKPACWECSEFEGHLYGLVSAPAVGALLYNKKVFQEAAPELRAAGCDPNRPPATIEELDRYAKAIDKWGVVGGRKQLVRMGYHPMEPGWYIQYTPMFFGGRMFDPVTQKITVNTPQAIAGFKWFASFSDRLGVDATADFRAGMGGFASPQNAFIVGQVAMEQQGPWMPNYFESFAPWMNHWHVQGEAEKHMTRAQRRDNCAWGAAPFPCADLSKHNVGSVEADVLCIPKTAKHKKEAFEFMAFVSRRDIIERLDSMQCKPSPLAEVSQDFIDHHPNPYIEVFEALLRSKDSFTDPRTPMWSEMSEELVFMTQKIFRHEMSVESALAQSQAHLDFKWAEYQKMRKMHQEAK